MIEIPSKIEGLRFDLYDLEKELKPIGYSIGGNWDYDHGFFDYKISDEGEYLFLRVPFQAIDGQLDSRGCTVKMGRPFLLAHQYDGDNDEEGEIGVFSASFNQFQSPEEKDGPIQPNYEEMGRSLVAELEERLLSLQQM